MADDILLSKAQTIEDCIRRIHEEFDNNPANLRQNQTKQDAIVLNLERACQACIDIAMRLVRLKKLGIPAESRDAFDLIFKAGLISDDLCKKMYGLESFRNTAIHNYKKLDLDIVEAVIAKHLSDMRTLSALAIKQS